MYKHIQMENGEIHLAFFTGLEGRDALGRMLAQRLTPRILGIVDREPTNQGLSKKQCATHT